MTFEEALARTRLELAAIDDPLDRARREKALAHLAVYFELVQEAQRASSRRRASVGRPMHAEGAAGGRDTDPTGEIEQPQPVAEQHVILGHATRSCLHLAVKGEPEPHNGQRPAAAGRCHISNKLSSSQLSGEPGDSPR